MSEIATKWKMFHDSLPKEWFEFTYYESFERPLIHWPSAVHLSWHYWKFLCSNNPFHGLTVAAALEKAPEYMPENLVLDCLAELNEHAKNLESRKKKFWRAHTEQRFLFIAQQLNLIGKIRLEHCFIRVMAKSESLKLAFVRAGTFEDKYQEANNNDPIFQLTKHLIKNHVLQHPERPTTEDIDKFIENYPSTDRVRILGSILDQ